MIIAGIIAEYNPFHNGHKYQIEKLKKEYHADYVIVAMSGNFLQRGVPAIADKYVRAKAALTQGADLVFELPVIWSTSSAEYFARAGVELFRQLGIVTHLCFGAETDNIELLKEIAHILVVEPEEYKNALCSLLKEGISFPAARSHALLPLLSFSKYNYEENTLQQILNSPNNILALEYLKALELSNATISPILIKREGDGYHDSSISSNFASATAIRRLLLHTQNDPDMSSFVPLKSLALLSEYQKQHVFLKEDDFSSLLAYRLLLLEKIGCQDYADCSEDFSNKIRKNLPQFESFSQFCTLLKSKEQTYTRISRSLIHILLNITKEDYNLGKELGYIPYLRVLGFHQNGTTLLHQIKKQASVPLITKVADAKNILSDSAYSIFEKDLFASNIYRQIVFEKCGFLPKNDFTHEIIRIDNLSE